MTRAIYFLLLLFIHTVLPTRAASHFSKNDSLSKLVSDANSILLKSSVGSYFHETFAVPEAVSSGQSLCKDLKPFVNSLLMVKWQNHVDSRFGFSVELTRDNAFGIGFGLVMRTKSKCHTCDY